MMNGEYGIDDVCLSTLSTVGKGGIKGRIETPLTDDELKLLHKSADALKNVISNLTI
jgi:L-lactate dehydrogenase